MSLIDVHDLHKMYTNDGIETPALRGVSFAIERGEFVAIMGPSGSGKSTLLHMLGFLDEHTRGTYRFDGKSMQDYGAQDIAHVRNKKMGFVFQAFHLLPRTTVLENVKLPLLYSAFPEATWNDRATKALEAVQLSHRLRHEPSQLSGGEKQRVAIARALVNDPDILFADEPTGNLDSVSGQAIMEILKALNQKDGHTIIVITHELLIAEHAKRIITIRDGLIASDRKL